MFIEKSPKIGSEGMIKHFTSRFPKTGLTI